MLVLEFFHDANLANTMRICIEDMGHSYVRAHSLGEANWMIDEYKPDIILLDLFDLSHGVTQNAMKAMQPEDFIGYNWAIDVIKNKPEYSNKIIISSSFFSENRFEKAFPVKKSEHYSLLIVRKFRNSF